MRYDYSGPGTLENIRLQLRGPIADSPFAGRDKQAKIAYCKRQIALLTKWYIAAPTPIFRKQIQRWERARINISKGQL